MNTKSQDISEEFIQSICARIGENKRVRRTLPVWGRVHIDRQLPFLCVYRRPNDGNDAGTETLLQGEASYLAASGDPVLSRSLRSLTRGIAATLSKIFGSVLILEIWSTPVSGAQIETSPDVAQSQFRILTPRRHDLTATIDKFVEALSGIKVLRRSANVEVVQGTPITSPGLRVLLTPAELKEHNVDLIGLELRPIYRDAASGQLFPLVLRPLQRALARTFKRVFFEFEQSRSIQSPPHFLALGRRAVVKAVWEADSQLAEVSNAFDLLLYVSPTNADSAFSRFGRSGFEKPPSFTYRPRPVDPILLKRRLYAIPLERIEDPVLEQLFRETQEYLDHRITLLADRGNSTFLYSSLRVFGTVSDSLLSLATQLLKEIPPRSRDSRSRGYLDADGFKELVTGEIAHYREQYSKFSARCEIREDITGLLCSRGHLLVGKEGRIPLSRANALLQHEVGTHLLTHYNGLAQPLKQLYLGLAGYDEMQEGLAVLAEYFVGGLSRPRMRLLAGRVIAVHQLVDGATFVDVFRELNKNLGFDKRTAFAITTRVFRSGGLTKDYTYLKGLSRLLQYFRDGGTMADVFVGKFNISHLPIIRELLLRRILHPPPLRPRYLDDPQSTEKLTALQKGASVFDLIR